MDIIKIIYSYKGHEPQYPGCYWNTMNMIVKFPKPQDSRFLIDYISLQLIDSNHLSNQFIQIIIIYL